MASEATKIQGCDEEKNVSKLNTLSAALKQIISGRAISMFSTNFRKAAMVLLDQGLSSISSLIVNVLVARACGINDYGVYVLAFTVLTTTRSVQVNLSGTPYTVIRGRLAALENSDYLGSVLVQQLAISIVIAVGFLFAGQITAAVGSHNAYAPVMFALGPASAAVMFRDMSRYILLAHMKTLPNLIVSLLVNATTITGTAYAYYLGVLSPWSAYAIMCCGCGWPLIALGVRYRRSISFDRQRFWGHVLENWRFGKWLLAQTAVYFLAVQVYPWAVTMFNGVEAAARYGACMTVAGALNPVFAGIAAYLGSTTARTARNDPSAVHQQVYLSMILLGVPCAAFLIVIAVWSEDIITGLYGSSYAGMGGALTLLFLSTFIAAESMLLLQGTNSLRRSDISFWAQVASLLGTLCIGMPMVKNYSVLGAGIGMCVSRIFALFYQLRLFRALK